MGKMVVEHSNLTFANGDPSRMFEASERARETFKYFWRELWWEHRRIEPALDMACVKIAFPPSLGGSVTSPMTEQMWIGDVYFDGIRVYGRLINIPTNLTYVSQGDWVETPFEAVLDWMFSIHGKTYGGFTVQAIRSAMSKKERVSHDKAWGLHFGDADRILLVYEQDKHPENLTEHPMSVNMRDKYAEFIRHNPDELTKRDDAGYTLLHKETIAGNMTAVEVLLQAGVDINVTTRGTPPCILPVNCSGIT